MLKMKIVKNRDLTPRPNLKATALKEKAINMLESLPEDKLESVIDYLKYLQGEYDSYDVNENLKEAFYEVKLIREGKIKTKTLKPYRF
jgi:hypothetical protein